MILTVENASFGFEKDKKIINSLNFSACSGELVAVLGPNGAGKTTLLRCIMGFLNWQSGKCCIDGCDIRSMPASEFWRRVSYVPQAKGSALGYTVEEMILLGASGSMGVFAAPGAKERKKAAKVAERLSIEGLLQKKCNEISGGELQMVLIARALASNPELLILDEPESNLDFKNQLIVLDTLSALAAEGVCCIFNTHYPAHALMRAARSLIVRKDGTSVFGETAAIVTEENIRSAFGVDTVINEVETGSNTYQSILPVGLSDAETHSETEKENIIAVISAVFTDFSLSSQINGILHEYSEYLIGRFGMPYREGGVYIINATLDAPVSEAKGLSHRLSVLPQVGVKTVYVKNVEKKNEK